MPSFIWDHVLTDLGEKSGHRSSKSSVGRTWRTKKGPLLAEMLSNANPKQY